MTIDWTQPIETTETPPRPVRVLATDLPGDNPVAVFDGFAIRRYMADGTRFSEGPLLRNTPPPKPEPEPVLREGWVNLYEDGDCDGPWPNKGTAEDMQGEGVNAPFVECRNIVWMSDGSPVPGEDAEVVALSLMAKERDSLRADADALRTHLVKALSVVDAAVAFTKVALRDCLLGGVSKNLSDAVRAYQNAAPATSDSHEALTERELEIQRGFDEMLSEPQWALFKNGQQISKAHSTKIAAATEAYEHGAVMRWTGDFTPGSGIMLASGYEVKEAKHD